MKPYKNQPGVLEMVIDDEFLSLLKVKQVEYPFGLSQEKFCYFEGVLVGCIATDTERVGDYYKSLDVECINCSVLTLIPVVPRCRS